jgi:hypothetical protein
VGEGFDLAEILGIADSELSRRLTAVFTKLKALATNKIQVAKEARELENRLGLNPKALAELRWTIVASPGVATAGAAPRAGRKSSRTRLTVVEAPNAVEGGKPAG